MSSHPSGSSRRSRSPSPAPGSTSQMTGRSAREESKEAFQTILEMSNLLQCQLTETELGYCVTLIEDGANPLKLAQLIKDWKARGKGVQEEKENGHKNGGKPVVQARARTAPEQSSRLGPSSTSVPRSRGMER